MTVLTASFYVTAKYAVLASSIAAPWGIVGGLAVTLIVGPVVSTAADEVRRWMKSWVN